MATGNRKTANALDQLAQSFLQTRPAAFNEFLNQPTNDPLIKTSVSGSPTDGPELLDKDSPVKDNDANVSNSPPDVSPPSTLDRKSNLEQSSDQFPTSSSETNNQPKRVLLTSQGKRKTNESYEGLFFNKSDPGKSDHRDVRVLLKGNHSKVISRLVMYAEHHKLRVSPQQILDNILRHHFETFAAEIRQMDQALIGILQQQINP